MPVQCEPALWTCLDGHGYQRYVRVGRLDALQLLVTIVRVDLVWLDGASRNHGDGLGGGLGAHVERLLQCQSDLSLAAGVRQILDRKYLRHVLQNSNASTAIIFTSNASPT